MLLLAVGMMIKSTKHWINELSIEHLICEQSKLWLS